MNTDTRDTNPVNGNFQEQLLEHFVKKEKVAILYEDNGVTREGGLITRIFEKDGYAWFSLDARIDILISKLYAVNGKFDSDYSEC
ncbi:MAG: hypothetical protein EOO02_23050 [Chitinophagaceae bacterium]|nr:MAG: hypothetical protein EOO02_23050 [Chitinophagaceae bacterium]